MDESGIVYYGGYSRKRRMPPVASPELNGMLTFALILNGIRDVSDQNEVSLL